MAMESDLLVRNENIQHLFDWYCSGYFLVNRKYQRKLVWTLEEKQKFINSIASNYPVPLVLLAKKNRGEKPVYEIIDGMQRLDAIFSFVRGDYSIEIEGQSKYFDLSAMAQSKEFLDKNILEQKSPIIDRSICSNIANYQLPISIINFDENSIEDIFRRINATGRQLSDQDLRQAGAVGAFPDLVRKLASDIRRDTSPEDTLELSKMKEISLSNIRLPYGIYMFGVFWVKQGIITIGNMRVSRDEELIAYILTYILLKDKVPPSARCLNAIYDYGSHEIGSIATKIEYNIEKVGTEKLRQSFMKVFDEIEKTLKVAKKPFNQLVFGRKSHGMARSFQVIFLAFYELLTTGKSIIDYKKLANRFDRIGTKHLSNISSSEWNAHYRHEKIQSIKGVLNDCFEDLKHIDPARDMWVSKMENLLVQSKIEQQLFDFKIGLHTLNNEVDFNPDVLKKIVKTLTAMANNGKSVTGYVLVGIADNNADAQKYVNLYNGKYKNFNGFYITGIQDEIKGKYKNCDEYFNKVRQFIGKEPIDEYSRSYILRNMRLVNYFDKLVLVFEIKSGPQPLFYENNYYERQGTSVVKIEAMGMANLFERFK